MGQVAAICDCEEPNPGMRWTEDLKCDGCGVTQFCWRCPECYAYVCSGCFSDTSKSCYWYASDEPFASGNCRYAYQGTKLIGGTSTVVVLKKFKDKTAYNENDWKGDMKCHRKAMEFIAGWNKLNLITKSYVMHMPTIIPAGRDVWKSKKGDDCIKENEYIMAEQFIPGDYEKWNSNSGWTSSKSMSVQAFCHWTYHKSRGNLLMCDAQGVRGEDNYYITDPAVMSAVAGQYGCADCGREGIEQWFTYHECNEFCDTSWLKPGRKRYSAFKVQRATTHRWKTGKKKSYY